MAAWINEAGLIGDRYFTSNWHRAQLTASTLLPGVIWQVDPRLGETDAGEVADWQMSNFLAKEPSFYSDPSNRYPGGETHLELNTRVLNWFFEQLEQPSATLMLVAHSGPISCILQHVLGMEMQRFPVFLPTHASLSVIDMTCQKGSWHGRLLGFSLGPCANLQKYVHLTQEERKA
jgi:broad specificity phosphatase PhoE